MKNLTSRIAAAGLLLTCLIFSAAPILAGENNENSKFLLVSFQENVIFNNATGTGTLDGKATFAGAFYDRCTRHEDFHVVSVNKDGTEVAIAGTSTFFGMTAGNTLTTS